MISPVLFIFIFLSMVQADEFLVAKSPPSVAFHGNDIIDHKYLSEIFSAALGFTTRNELKWKGMKIVDPFGFAKALAILYVEGISSLGNFENMKTFKFKSNSIGDISTSWDLVKNKIVDRYPWENNTVVNVHLKSVENNMEDKSQTYSIDENALGDGIHEFKSYLNGFKKSSSGVPDLYWFTLKNLPNLKNFKDTNSGVERIKSEVFNLLSFMSDKIGSMYNGQVLIAAISSDTSHVRKTRNVVNERAETPVGVNDLKNNIYDPDFPVIFNIILWFTVALIFALLAVSVFIASMDPGRDSIIYRMTSNKMKKDS